MLRRLLIRLSKSPWARRWVTSFPPTRRVAMRFVAGERLEDAVRAVGELNGAGVAATIDHLGEHTATEDEARASADVYRKVLGTIDDHGLDANVSLKPTQLGLALGEDVCYENVQTVVDRARELGNFVRIDMEDSGTVDATLRVYERLREADYANVGVVIQAYLFRSKGDVHRLIEWGSNVRLCKGAYAEPPSVAFPQKGDVDENFQTLLQQLWQPEAIKRGTYAAVATHDERLIRWCEAYVRDNGVPTDRFEFQLLYGIRRDLQRELAEKGYRVRIYVSYGTEWYPFFMRRLAERPANMIFIARQLFRE